MTDGSLLKCLYVVRCNPSQLQLVAGSNIRSPVHLTDALALRFYDALGLWEELYARNCSKDDHSSICAFQAENIAELQI